MSGVEGRPGVPYTWQPGPIERDDLRRFGEASGDENPLHTDPDAARAVGFDDVIAHGMLLMAYAARAVTDVVPQRDLRELRVRFRAVTPVGATPRCRVAEGERVGDDEGHEPDDVVRRLAIDVTLGDGTVVCQGEARADTRQNPEIGA